jgi:hypothetical protein
MEESGLIHLVITFPVCLSESRLCSNLSNLFCNFIMINDCRWNILDVKPTAILWSYRNRSGLPSYEETRAPSRLGDTFPNLAPALST